MNKKIVSLLLIIGQSCFLYAQNNVKPADIKILTARKVRKEPAFTLPSVNKGQKVVKAYMVNNQKQIEAHQTGNREITFSGFDKPANQIAIIAIELNKSIME